MRVYVNLMTGTRDFQIISNREIDSLGDVYDADSQTAKSNRLVDLEELEALFGGTRRNGTIDILGRNHQITCTVLIIRYHGLRRCVNNNAVEAWGEAIDQEWERFIAILRHHFPPVVAISLQIPGTVHRFDDRLLTDSQWAQVIGALNHTGTLRDAGVIGMLDDMPRTMEAIGNLSNLTDFLISNDALDMSLAYLEDVLADEVTGDLDHDTYKDIRGLGMLGGTGMCGITHAFFTGYICPILQKHKGTLNAIRLEGLVFCDVGMDYFTPLGASMFPNHRLNPKFELPWALLPGRYDSDRRYKNQEDWLHTSHTTLEEVNANDIDENVNMDSVPGAWPVIYAKNNMAVSSGHHLSRLLADHFVPAGSGVPTMQNVPAFVNALVDFSTGTPQEEIIMALERLNIIYALAMLEPQNITKSLYIHERIDSIMMDRKRSYDEMAQVATDYN